MNEFEGLCALASRENWCWKLGCGTCGHLHFRYALRELAEGKSPQDHGWIVHNYRYLVRKLVKSRARGGWSNEERELVEKCLRYGQTRFSRKLGPMPDSYSQDQQESILRVCGRADLARIAETCRFPDWLGYLGLILSHMRTDTSLFRSVSARWAAQLMKLVPSESEIYARLREVSYGRLRERSRGCSGVLQLDDLEQCERVIGPT